MGGLVKLNNDIFCVVLIGGMKILVIGITLEISSFGDFQQNKLLDLSKMTEKNDRAEIFRETS